MTRNATQTMEFFASPDGVVPREDVLSGMTADPIS